MNADLPFAPIYGTGQVINATTTAASVTIPPNAKALVITNIGGELVYVRVGATDAVSGIDYPVLAGTQVVLGKPEGAERVSAICASTGQVHVMAGRGI